MTSVGEATGEAQPAGPPACLECGEALAGRFCHACGVDNQPPRLPMGELLGNAVAETFNLEGRTFRTTDAMLRRPGELLVAFREGRGHRYTTPFKLFLIVSAAFFVFLVWTDVAIYQFLPVRAGEAPIRAELVPNGVRLVGGALEDVFLVPRADAAAGQETIAALEAVRPGADATQARAIADFIQYQRAWTDLNSTLETWLPRLLWLLMPIYGLMLWPLFGASRRPLVEHFVFALWAHAMIFILLMLFAALNWIGLRISFWLLGIPYLAYFTLAARRYYDTSTFGAAWRGVVHLLAFFVLAWAPIAIGVAWASAWDDLPATFWAAETSGSVDAIDRWVLPAAGGEGPP